jgi:hypothetical protein
MPFGILLLIAGLIVLFVWPVYTTLALIIMGIGVAIILVSIVVVIAGLLFFNKVKKEVDRDFGNFFNDGERRALGLSKRDRNG